jgi:hypothetical protein
MAATGPAPSTRRAGWRAGQAGATSAALSGWVPATAPPRRPAPAAVERQRVAGTAQTLCAGNGAARSGRSGQRPPIARTGSAGTAGCQTARPAPEAGGRRR